MEIINLGIPYYIVLKSVYSTLRICRMCCFFVLGHDFAATMDKREKNLERENIEKNYVMFPNGTYQSSFKRTHLLKRQNNIRVHVTYYHYITLELCYS